MKFLQRLLIQLLDFQLLGLDFNRLAGLWHIGLVEKEQGAQADDMDDQGDKRPHQSFNGLLVLIGRKRGLRVNGCVLRGIFGLFTFCIDLLFFVLAHFKSPV